MQRLIFSALVCVFFVESLSFNTQMGVCVEDTGEKLYIGKLPTYYNLQNGWSLEDCQSYCKIEGEDLCLGLQYAKSQCIIYTSRASNPYPSKGFSWHKGDGYIYSVAGAVPNGEGWVCSVPVIPAPPAPPAPAPQPQWSLIGQGGCRNAANQGLGLNRFYVNIYQHDLQTCKASCAATTGCVGIEHFPTSNQLAGFCRIFTNTFSPTTPAGFVFVAGNDLTQQIVTSTGQHPNNMVCHRFEPVQFSLIGQGRCRNAANQDLGLNFFFANSYDHDLQTCETTCVGTTGCVGVEHFPTFNQFAGFCKFFTNTPPPIIPAGFVFIAGNDLTQEIAMSSGQNLGNGMVCRRFEA